MLKKRSPRPPRPKKPRLRASASIRFTDDMDAAIRAATAQITTERLGQAPGHADTVRILIAEALYARHITITKE